MTSEPLNDLRFERTFVDALPMDESGVNRARHVHGAAGSLVQPTPVASPTLIAWSKEVADSLGMSAQQVQSARFARVFSGNELLEGMVPYAMCYGGHQFGNWAGQLGDGRAINLGELVHEGTRSVLQLKGAGPTPYSRRADGRAVMRSSVREFLCSEAMHHLGVPTTRALSLVSTGDEVVRDMFYDGNPAPEPGAVVCRVAPNFIRFGNLQMPAARKDTDLLKDVLAYTITTSYPDIARTREQALGQEGLLAFVREVSERTARMIVEWMRVGFVHGVMNTDNMSVLGLTIDYGPYGWLEGFDLEWTPNTTDFGSRRYAFGEQPKVGYWNVMQMAHAVGPLIEDISALQEAVSVYEEAFATGEQAMLASKLGLARLDSEEDQQLIGGLVEALLATETDMTIFYRALMDVPLHEDASDAQRVEAIAHAYYSPPSLDDPASLRMQDWLARYAQRARREPVQARRDLMKRTNPKFVLRNYLAQLAIDRAEQRDGEGVMELLDVLRRPYDEQPEHEAAYAGKRPEWARHRPGCSTLSCSS